MNTQEQDKAMDLKLEKLDEWLKEEYTGEIMNLTDSDIEWIVERVDHGVNNIADMTNDNIVDCVKAAVMETMQALCLLSMRRP